MHSNGEAKEFIHMTHGHELSGGGGVEGRKYWREGGKGRKSRTTVIPQSTKYTLKKEKKKMCVIWLSLAYWVMLGCHL